MIPILLLSKRGYVFTDRDDNPAGVPNGQGVGPVLFVNPPVGGCVRGIA